MKISKRSAVAANRRRIKAPCRTRPIEPVRCPRQECRSVRTRVYDSNNHPVRYHVCLACGQRFKSVEKIIRGEPLMKGD